MPTLVYRVENPGGTGPYQVCGRPPLLDKLLERHGRLKRTPMPIRDNRFSVYEWDYPAPELRHRFGFVDLRSLKTWFSAVERSLLAANRFAIHVYEVDEIDWIGRSGQLYFDRENAVHIETLNLTKKGY
jgi:hypothetical protein